MLKDVLFKSRNKFNLQLFAEETGNSNVDDNNGNTDDDNSVDNDTQKKQPADPRKVPKYSEDDVDEIIKKRVARSEKEKSEAERLARMSEAEKTNAKLQSLEDRIKAYEQKETLSEMTKTARAILQGENINISDELLANLVTSDADKTKASVDSFIKLFKAEVEKAKKEAYKGTTPKSGGSPAGMTKEQAEAKLKSITNPKERRDFIQQNMDLFQN